MIGGGVTRKQQTLVDARDFGVVGGSSADQSSAVQAAIDSLGVQGGEIRLPKGEIRIGTTVRVDSSDVALVGTGSGGNHGAGDAAESSTRFLWVGDAGGTMLRIEPQEGAGYSGLSGCRVDALALYGASSAAYGLVVRSHRGGIFRAYMKECTTAALYTGCVTTLAESNVTRENWFDIKARQLLATDGAVAWLDGSANDANTCFNTFTITGFFGANQDGLIVANTDNNLFLWVNMYRSAGAKYGVRLKGSSGLANETARANLFLNVSSGGGVYAEGTGDATYPSTNNVILAYDTENGNPAPVRGTGATLSWLPNTGAVLPQQGTAFP